MTIQQRPKAKYTQRITILLSKQEVSKLLTLMAARKLTMGATIRNLIQEAK